MPSFGGANIFGTAVTMTTTDNPREQQLNAFFGLSGLESLDGGLRGRVTNVGGLLYSTPAATLGLLELLFRSYNDGIARPLVDTLGTTWMNVRLESFSPVGPRAAVSLWGVLPIVSSKISPLGVIAMAFSQSSISGITLHQSGTDLLISWSSSAAAGTIFQVYVDQRLCWYGKAKRCQVPIPSSNSNRNIWVDVGTVAPSEAPLNFADQLTSLLLGIGKATLTWSGGTYLDSTGQDQVQGFRIYGSPSAGSPVDLTKSLVQIPAYPGNWISDGFGLGGFGSGGFGRSASSYEWTATGLSTGTWQFCVMPYDPAGNDRGPGQTSSVVIQTAPLPPAANSCSRRLTSSYSGSTTRLVTLNWLASPSA